VFLKAGIMDVSVIEVSHKVINQFWFLVDVIVYEPLENGGCIHETECHDVELEGAIRGVEGGEPLLTFLDA